MARKLAAILVADVAGFSRLMGADEAGTVSALRASRAVFERLIANHHGRIFGGAGDSVIAEFGSAVEATESALAIQKELASGKASGATGPNLRFRIGLNLGDVVVDGDNLLGDGVNVASRIEAMAEPGGVYLSRAVFEQIRGKIDVVAEPLGPQSFKNIERPVEVYRIALDGKLRPAHTKLLAALRKPKRTAGAVVAAALLLVGIVAWQVWMVPRTATGKPSIAILPFTTIGGDDATRRLADGLTEDVITDLSHFGGLDVVASSSTNKYKGKAFDLRDVGRTLGVSYILEGTVQREGAQLRISAQLVAPSSGSHLWAQRWDRTATDVFAIQNELAEQVAATLGSMESSAAITASEIAKVKGQPPASLQAYDYYLLAVEARGESTKASLYSGIEAAGKAIALDPNFARAYATRARLVFNTSHHGADYEAAMHAMEADARKAVELAPNDPEARAALAWFYFNRGRNKEAETELRSALTVNPANISLIKFAAAVFSASGHPEEGAALADKVLRLDPFASSGTLNTIKDAYFFALRFEDTAAVISRVPPEARSKGARLMLAASLSFLGRKEEAARARSELLAAHPTISAELLANQGWKFERPEDDALFLDAFKSLELPLCATDSDLAKIVKPQRLAGCPRS